MTLEQAQQELKDREAAVVAAQSRVDEAIAQVDSAKAEVAAITTKIEQAADDEIEQLAAERATATARVEARAARLERKQGELVEAQAEARKATLVVDELVLADERARVVALDAALAEVLARAAAEVDSLRQEITEHRNEASRAGLSLVRAKGETPLIGMGYTHTAFDTTDQVVEAFRREYSKHGEAREQQQRNQQQWRFIQARQAEASASAKAAMAAAAPEEVAGAPKWKRPDLHARIAAAGGGGTVNDL